MDFQSFLNDGICMTPMLALAPVILRSENDDAMS